MADRILVLWGSHFGIETHAGANFRLLKRLIHLHHGIELPAARVVTDGNTARTRYNAFIADAATSKYLYFVGHGDVNGNLMFSDGVQLDLGSFAARPKHLQFVELYLFMCYEHKAYERLRTTELLNHLPIVIFEHEYTQSVRDEINDRIFAYQLRLDSSGVLTQTTQGDPMQGHFFLCQEVRKAESPQRNQPRLM